MQKKVLILMFLGVVALLDPEVCYCVPGDNTSGICPCCEENYVSCGVSAQGVCVQQDVAWLCDKVRPGMILVKVHTQI